MIRLYRTEKFFFTRFELTRLVCLALFLTFALTGCAGKHASGEINFKGKVLDLNKFPQDLTPFARAAGETRPLLAPARQAAEAERYKTLFFKPWSLTKSSTPRGELAKLCAAYAKKQGYQANGEPLPAGAFAQAAANANTRAFPSAAFKGIVVNNTALRALPTVLPHYANPKLPGEGYPFDYLQYSALWVGTPVFVSHISKDRNWLFCETAFVSGWVLASDVAFVSDAFVARWQQLPLGAVLSDNLSISSQNNGQSAILYNGAYGGPYNAASAGRDSGAFSMVPSSGPTNHATWANSNPLVGPDQAGASNSSNRIEPGRGGPGSKFALRLGTLLPFDGKDVLLPVAGGQAGNSASWRSVSAAAGSVGAFPVPVSAGQIAALGNQMLGAPYGWGGIDYNRDCSSLLRDLFTPFGLWLPRNSSQQIKEGQDTDISYLNPAQKEGLLKSLGVPFLTLLGMPGHVALYVGQFEGEPAIFHSIWAARLRYASGNEQNDGRLIIGKVAVTSLQPGAEYVEVQNAGTLIKRFKVMTVLGY